MYPFLAAPAGVEVETEGVMATEEKQYSCHADANRSPHNQCTANIPKTRLQRHHRRSRHPRRMCMCLGMCECLE